MMDAAEIQNTARLLMALGQVSEVRIPKTARNGTISGYFDSPDKIPPAIAKYDGTVPGIYITLNPCNPALLARAANRMKERAEITTGDVDILHRTWLLIDCDPKRPAGISSTDDEHGRAIAVACGVWDDLHSEGFPDPVVADSGNGAHLLFQISLSNTAETTQLVKRILSGVAKHSSTDDVAIDVTVHNAARITKLYGTLVCKGDPTPDRPHRRSCILEIPDPLCVVAL